MFAPQRIRRMHLISRNLQSSQGANYGEIPRSYAGSLPLWHKRSLSARTWICPFTSIAASLKPSIRQAEMRSRRATSPFLLQGQLPCSVAVAEVRKASQREMLREELWQGQSKHSLQKNDSMLYLSVGCSAVLFNYFVCLPDFSPSQARQGTPFW